MKVKINDIKTLEFMGEKFIDTLNIGIFKEGKYKLIA